MNCKPGDLAVIRPSYGVSYEIGAVVVVQRMGADGEVVTMRDGGEAECTGIGVAWLCDSRVTDAFPCFIRDRHLRPIRDSDGADETLTWAGKPQPVEA